MQRGEVRWYRFGRPDKRRPVVILTRDSILTYLGEVTVAPVTTTIRDIPSEVLLSAVDGMPSDCAINLDYIQTVSKGKVVSLLQPSLWRKWSSCDGPSCSLLVLMTERTPGARIA